MFPKQIQDRLDKGIGCWSDIGDGWIPLIVELDKKLTEINPDYTIDQIKEKFGGLRFYASGLEHDGAYKLIEEAESKSYMICEECGTSGARRTIKGWLKTLCDKHYLESKGQ